MRMINNKVDDVNSWEVQSQLRFHIELAENNDVKINSINPNNMPSIKHIPSIKDFKIDVFNNPVGSFMKDER
jgi:hypothetical protein